MQTPDLMPEHKAQLPRSSHVLSHDLGFTCTTGHLLPVFHTFLNPGEKVNLGFDFNLRTMELEAAAFADLETHVEYFFVPMQLLYQPFENVVYDIRNQFSSNFASSSADDKAVLPLLDFQNVFQWCYVNRTNAALKYSDTNIPVESLGQSCIRLFDLLGFNPIPLAAGVSNPTASEIKWYLPNVFPYQLLAYHCIYEYYYRMDTRETFRNYLFNWDKFYKTNLVQANVIPDMADFMSLHYRPLRNDYFTDIKVSPIVDVLNLDDKDTLAVTNSWLTRSQSDATLGSSVILSQGNKGLSSQPPVANRSAMDSMVTNFGFNAGRNDLAHINPVIANSQIGVYGTDINTANIRAIFANEKLWAITGRAKKTYDDQTLAHFGFKVPHDVKHEITCFGKDDNRIHIGEVISTANTELSPLGEIAGKGYGKQEGKRHSFTAPCHGVVMAIFSVECVHNYEAGIAKHNAVSSKFDFYIPEYDHLGMQPLFYYETMYMYEQLSDPSAQVGWQYRYEQWKRRYNRTTGAFRNTTGALKSWIPTFAPYGGNYLNIGESGKDDNEPGMNSYRSFLNLPTDVNQLFLAQYPSVWSQAYESEESWSAVYDMDPFVVNSHIDCTLVSTMSDYSLPRLDA